MQTEVNHKHITQFYVARWFNCSIMRFIFHLMMKIAALLNLCRMWGTFLADIVIQMLGTDYARILRAIYALAQVNFSLFCVSLSIAFPIMRLNSSDYLNRSALHGHMVGLRNNEWWVVLFLHVNVLSALVRSAHIELVEAAVRMFFAVALPLLELQSSL